MPSSKVDVFSFGGVACAAATNGSCTNSISTLCLQRFAGDRRFQVQVSFNTQQGNGEAGAAIPMPLTGLGFGDGEVLDACSLNNRFWVFLAATTNVGFTATVTDTVTGHQAIYTNPDRTPAQPVQDTNALACP